jgi:3D (Asp-Asp-Asp) domain-containing protein
LVRKRKHLINFPFLHGGLSIGKRLIKSLYSLSMPARALGLLALCVVLLSTAAAASRKASKSSSVYTVTATAYEAVASQTDSKPFITADNSRIPRGYGSHTRWIALSRDLLKPWGGPFEFGDKVRVEGISPALDGVYTVHDTMNRRYRHRLDVLAHPREHLSLSRTGPKYWCTRQGSAKPRAADSPRSRAKQCGTSATMPKLLAANPKRLWQSSQRATSRKPLRTASAVHLHAPLRLQLARLARSHLGPTGRLPRGPSIRGSGWSPRSAKLSQLTGDNPTGTGIH